MKPVHIFSLAVTILCLACNSKQDRFHIITEDEYLNRTKAGWIGQMAGVGWAAPTEFRYIFNLMPAEAVPAWQDSAVNQYGQDDLYVEMTFMKTLEDNGFQVSQRQAGIDFANSLYGLACANELGRENLRYGIAPPESGHPEHNFRSDDIDYQIEADYSGLISPGMPNRVITLGNTFGKLMNYGDGVYGGIFVGGMYAAAFFETDRMRIVEAGLSCIPEKSDYAQCVRDMIQWFREDSLDWKKTWQKIDAKYIKDSTYQKLAATNKKAWPGIDAKVNGAYVLLGFLYGMGNLDSTIIISMRAGLDSDCNPSSAAGILATTIGYNQLPEKYTRALITDKKYDNTSYDFNTLIEVCKKLARQQVKLSGGKIREKRGITYFYIPKMPVRTPALEQSYNPAPADPNNRFTDEEMEKIKLHSAISYEPLMLEAAPGWKVGNCSRAVEARFFSWHGVDNALALMPVNLSTPCYINTEVAIPENEKSFLKFNVSNEPGKEWILEINLQWYPKKRIVINDELCKNGWYEVSYDLDEFNGNQRLFVRVSGAPSNGNISKTYWSNIRIETMQ